jgi:G3E family GTPase
VFYNQLNLADLILLNKIDLLEKDEIGRFLKEIHAAVPHATVVPTIHCRVDPETIWAQSPGKVSKLKLDDFSDINLIDPRPHEANHHRHDNVAITADADKYMAFSFQDSRVMDETCFKRFIENLPWELFRLKDRTALINFVGGKCDWQDWRGSPETRLVFIGWNVDSEETIKRLKNCLIRTSSGRAATKKD